jgi:hypothetical protein
MSNSSNTAPRKCSSCGKRRVPAKRAGGRTSTKCKECFGGQFWLSSFGRWFAEATTRQSPDSMPFNEEDISGIYQLWKTRKSGIGYKLKWGQAVPKYDYHISHRDPAKGNGYQGRFTTENLLIATAKANKEAYNANPIDHGHRVYTLKKPFGTSLKVRQWCGGQYDLIGLVNELELKKYKPPIKDRYVDTDFLTNDTSPSNNDRYFNPDFLPSGISPKAMLEQQLKRFEGGSTSPWRHTVGNPSDQFSTAIIYGIGLGSGKLKEGPEEPLEEPGEDF